MLSFGKASAALHVLSFLLMILTLNGLPVLPSPPQKPDFPTVDDAIIHLSLTTLHTALENLDLLGKLDNSSLAVTLLAPTNAAFKHAANELNTTVPELLEMPELLNIIDLHLIPTPLELDDIIEKRDVGTESGLKIEVITEEVDEKVTYTLSGPINSAHVTKEDITAAKSIIHIIDAVLLPEL